MRPYILLVVLAVAWSSAAFPQGEPSARALELEKPFIYADLVVEGVIEKITRVTVPQEDYLPGIVGGDMPMAIMEFRIDSVLVGYQPKDYIDIVAGVWTSPSVYYFDFVEGDRCILSLKLPTIGKLFEPGRYLVRGDSEKFLLEGTRWFQGSKTNRLAEGGLQELYDVLEKVRRERSIEHLTEEAELIIRGVVLDSWKVEEQTEEGITKRIIRTRLDVYDVLKGTVEEGSISISTIRKGFYSPEWRMRVPDLKIGEEWILFLKSADEPGYYPFAGVNGLFLVEGDDLYRNNNSRILLHISPEELEAQVRLALEGGE